MALVCEVIYNKVNFTSKCRSSATNNSKMRGYEMSGCACGGTVFMSDEVYAKIREGCKATSQSTSQ
jgi:hypothetical protein